MMRKLQMTSGRLLTQSQTVHAKRRNISYSVEVHQRYQKYTYITGYIVEENFEDYWNVDGEKIVRCMDRIHKIHLFEWKATCRIYMVQGGDWRGNTHPQDPTVCARYVEANVWCSKKQSEAKVGYRQTKARSCQTTTVYLLHWTRWWKFWTYDENARRKLEIPMPAALRCKTPTNCRCENCSSIGKHKTQDACIVDADDESMRIRVEEIPQRYHEDHITEKGVNSLSHDNLVHKFIPMPPAFKKIRCKGSSVKRIGKTWENTSMTADVSQKQERSDRWSKK